MTVAKAVRFFITRLPLAGLASVSCQAQPSPLTLADCQSLAESAPSQVTIARAESQIARAGVGVAKSAFLPQSSLATGYTYNTPTSGQPTFIALNGVREYQAFAATHWK